MPGDVCARINGIDLLQILLNLATNALQCTPTPHRVEIHGCYLTGPLDLQTGPTAPRTVTSTGRAF